jgi:hypothetical protein
MEWRLQVAVIFVVVDVNALILTIKTTADLTTNHVSF